MENKHPLAVWRENQNPPLSQDDLAKKLGIGRWMVNSIETRRRNASLDMAEAIEGFTGGSVCVAALVHPDIAKRLPTPAPSPNTKAEKVA